MIQFKELGQGAFDIKLDKSFDFECHREFRSFVKKISEEKAKKLSIDFGAVEYIDSSALGMLMLAKHEAEAINCAVELYNINNSHTKNVLNLVKFDKMFTIKETAN